MCLSFGLWWLKGVGNDRRGFGSGRYDAPTSNSGDRSRRSCGCFRYRGRPVRKVVRGKETEFRYERSVQPAPKLGEWIEVLTGMLEAEAKLPRRERPLHPAAVRRTSWARL